MVKKEPNFWRTPVEADRARVQAELENVLNAQTSHILTAQKAAYVETRKEAQKFVDDLDKAIARIDAESPEKWAAYRRHIARRR